MKRLTVIALMLPLAGSGVGQSVQKLAEINKKVVGKWVSADRKNYIEFFAKGSCATGELSSDGKWQAAQNTLGAWQEGDDFSCGSGGLTLIGPNVLTRDYGMGGEPEKFYRGAANLPKLPGALTLATAHAALNQQIDNATADNMLFTCHACYDPVDKGDNDRAPLVTTCPPQLEHYWIRVGYLREIGSQLVFTAKAKQSRYYQYGGHLAGMRFAHFRNSRILGTAIGNPRRVPIEYDFVTTEIATGAFHGPQRIRSVASFSYENEAWRVCIACSKTK